MSKLYFIALILLSFPGVAQRVENVSVGLETIEGRVYYRFSYALSASKTNIPTYVRLKVKTDVREFYARDVEGDVGELVYPGSAKAFVWDYTKELVHFSGDIDYSLEVEPMVRVSSKAKRGKEVVATVRNSLVENAFTTVALYRGDVLVSSQEKTVNGNSIEFPIPRNAQAKRDYQIALVHDNQKYFSNTFKVTPRVRRSIYVLAGVGIAAAILLPDVYESLQPLPEAPSID